MGYRGKVTARENARELRLAGMRVADIASELGVSKSSVSLWVRDLGVAPANRRASPNRRPSRLHLERVAQTSRLAAEGRARIGALSERDLLIAGTALYAGEGSKTQGLVVFTNSDPRMVAVFCRWLRAFFPIEESRLRGRLYLHEGLDLDTAVAFWERATGIPSSQFTKPYRAAPDPSIRQAKHPMGCLAVRYADAAVHRMILGLVDGLLT